MTETAPTPGGRAIEAIVDPELAICDAHHHLSPPGGHYPLDELLADLASGHNIVSTVFVDCRARYREGGPPDLRPVGETEFVDAMAERCALDGNVGAAIASGIVGFANLALGAEVVRVLEAHLAASPARFKGVRHSVTWDASPDIRNSSPDPRPGWLLDPAFRAGLACLAGYGLTFDAWLFFPQLPELASIARAHPDVPIAVNHIGGVLGVGPYADKRAEVFDHWRRAIDELAACANVYMKLGGLGTPRCGFGWDKAAMPPTSEEVARATAPYYLHCIDRFGVDRCMFESNFHVDKASYSYRTLWNSFKRLTRGFSTAERDALFRGTAHSFYRLGSTAK